MASQIPANGSTSDPTSPYQNALNSYCQPKGITPQYQIMTDRRGGRTAWSAAVVIGQEKMTARFWYDGQFVNNAKEDAAQVALMHLRVMPRQARNGS